MEIFSSSAYAPFVAAILVVVALGVIEIVSILAIGSGLSDFAEWLSHTDTLPEAAWTNWLIVRGLPLSIAIVLFFTSFGVAGIAVQSAASAWAGSELSVFAAVCVALVAAWICLQVGGKALAPLFGTNTTAVTLDTLIGKKATILSPQCRTDLLAEVRVADAHGAVHTLMVSPAEGEPTFVEGDEVVLHERAHHGFTVRKA